MKLITLQSICTLWFGVSADSNILGCILSDYWQVDQSEIASNFYLKLLKLLIMIPTKTNRKHEQCRGFKPCHMFQQKLCWMWMFSDRWLKRIQGIAVISVLGIIILLLMVYLVRIGPLPQYKLIPNVALCLLR